MHETCKKLCMKNPADKSAEGAKNTKIKSLGTKLKRLKEIF